LLTLLRIYLLLLAGIWLFQRRLIYFPERSGEVELEQMAGGLGLRAMRNEANEIVGWRNAAGASGVRRMVVFHGNAGNASYRCNFVEGFERVNGGGEWEVTLAEYPGYGARPGKPSRASFASAADALLETLWREKQEPVVLLGESLGAAVASELAARHPEKIAGLILVTPFTSLAAVAQSHYPFLPAALLVRDRYDNEKALARLDQPVAFVIAEKDEVVPAKFGEQLYENYRGPKRCWTISGAGHNTIDYAPGLPFWTEISEFLRSGT
jgi:pimeloyl-ACP methyl ester carboxylesterase